MTLIMVFILKTVQTLPKWQLRTGIWLSQKKSMASTSHVLVQCMSVKLNACDI